MLTEVLPNRIKALPPQSASEFFLQIADQMLAIYEGDSHELETEAFGALRQLRQRREPAEYAGLIARTLFDVDLLVLPRT